MDAGASVRPFASMVFVDASWTVAPKTVSVAEADAKSAGRYRICPRRIDSMDLVDCGIPHDVIGVVASFVIR
jgi:hypothetical protein